MELEGRPRADPEEAWRLLLVIVLELLLLDIVHCLLISAVTIWLQTLMHLGQ